MLRLPWSVSLGNIEREEMDKIVITPEDVTNNGTSLDDESDSTPPIYNFDCRLGCGTQKAFACSTREGASLLLFALIEWYFMGVSCFILFHQSSICTQYICC
jgi:hypothetical protein